MKLLRVRAILTFLFLVGLFPASLAAISVYDVVRLSQGKYSDAEIIRIIQATDSRFVLTADDTTRLKKEGVTEPIIREMLSRPVREKANVTASKSAAKPARPSTPSKDSKKEVQVEQASSSPDPAIILDEIVRLTKAGLSDDTVLAYAKAHRADLPSVLSDDRLGKLRQSGVSEKVVRYLTAIDVRASDEFAGESTAAYGSGDGEYESHSTGPAYSYPAEDYGNGGYDTSYYGDSPYASYPATDYSNYYGGYPFYGEIYYTYPAYFFINRGNFLNRFHHRRDFRDHRRDGDHRRHFDRPRSPRPSPGWRDRPIRARDNFTQVPRQPRAPMMGRGMPPRTAIAPRAFAQVPRSPRGPIVGRGAASGPAITGSRPPAPSVARAPISRPSGGPASPGRPAPIIRR